MVVYCTTNLINFKKYIGKDSRNNPKYLGSGTNLRKDIKIYGKENFKKQILEYCLNNKELLISERYWTDYFNADKSDLFYNIHPGGGGGDNYTNHPDKEIIRKRMSDGVKASNHREVMASEKVRNNISNGINNSEAYKLSMLSEERSKKLSIKLKYRVKSEKECENISKGLLDHYLINDSSLKDVPKTEECKDKIRDTLKAKIHYCIHCKKYFQERNYNKYHGDHCYDKPGIDKEAEKLRRQPSDKARENMSKAGKGRPKKKEKCTKCSRMIAANMIDKWHNDNCRGY